MAANRASPPNLSLLLIASAKAVPRYWQAESERALLAKLKDGWEMCPWFFPSGAPSLEGNVFFQDSDVLAVCLVAHGVAYTGPLTRWSSEERLQWEAYGHAQDAYSCHVHEVATLLEPCEVVNNVLQSQDKDIHLFPVTQTSFHTLLQRAVVSHRGQGTLIEFLTQEGYDPAKLGTTNPLCMKAPPVLAALFVTRQLRHIMLLARWPCKARLFRAFPPETMFAKVPRGTRVPPLEAIPSQATSLETVQKLQGVADFLRSLAPHLQANPPDGWAADILTRACEEHVVCLEQLASSLDPRTTLERDTFPAQTLIRWMQAASLLRNRGRLKEVVEVAMTETVPLICQGKCRQQLRVKQGGVPSRETIRRARLVFDGALSLHARQSLFSPPPCLFVGADSSPQGGSNWLLIQLDMFMPEGGEQRLAFLKAWHSLWKSKLHCQQRDIALLSDDEDTASDHDQFANATLEHDDGVGAPEHIENPQLRDIRPRVAKSNVSLWAGQG